MKNATLLCWAKSGEAGKLVSYVIPQCEALRAARALNADGRYGETLTCCPGHGVTIVYASGRRREVKA